MDPFRPDILAGVSTLRAGGYDQREIADRLKVSEKTVGRYVRELRRRADKDGAGQVVKDAMPVWDLFWPRRRVP